MVPHLFVARQRVWSWPARSCAETGRAVAEPPFDEGLSWFVGSGLLQVVGSCWGCGHLRSLAGYTLRCFVAGQWQSRKSDNLTPQHRLEVVQRMSETDRPITRAARNLGIGKQLLGWWVQAWGLRQAGDVNVKLRGG